MEDSDNKEEKKMSLPPIPPGFMKPGSPPPPLPGGGKPVLPSLPGGAPGLPFAQPQGLSAAPAPFSPRQPQRDASAEESARLKEDKDKLEKKIVEMEKVVSQEKEKALLAALKNQQDEALSSKVESSLKDIQDKLRRDRHEQEVQEERITLKSKVKDLETRLVQERETWMQTLKGQIQERETQSKDVEGHFIYRLQEMERRWLEEKALWQRTISQKEDEVRSLKSSAEKLREVEDEFRRAAMEKEMQAREISRLRDEVAKIDREKASIESYIKNVPEREREFSDMRAENAVLRAREEKAHNENKLADEKFRFEVDKMQKEVGRLQSEIGAIADRKNAEKDEELGKLQLRHEAALQEKEKALAETSGEKIRALSELVKLKGFISRVQAINAVLEKERQALRLEKMQMAQAMASNIEDARKSRSEIEAMKAAHQAELEGLAKKHQAEVQKFKNDYAAEFAEERARQLADLQRRHQEELSAADKKNQEELAALEIRRKLELEGIKAGTAAALEERTLELRNKYEAEVLEIRAGVKRELEQYEAEAGEIRAVVKKELEREYLAELAALRAAKARAEEEKGRLEAEAKRSGEEIRRFDARLAFSRKEAEDAGVAMSADHGRLEAQLNSLMAVKADYEKRFAAMEGDRARLGTEISRLNAEYSSAKAQLDAALDAKSSREREAAGLAQELKTESGNRAGLEAELPSLKQKLQELELRAEDLVRRLEVEKQNSALSRDAAAKQAQASQARLAAVSAELEKYKRLEKSFPERMKWALKPEKS